jgi:hypothetical protein
VEAIVASLGEKIDALKDVVEGLIPAPGDSITELPGNGQQIDPDDSPAKKPWHKRGLFN